MKTKLRLFLFAIGLLSTAILHAQTNYTTTLPAGQEVRNLASNICCFMKVNVATDNDGNAYVLSFVPSDSSMWVTKYNNGKTGIWPATQAV